MAIAAFDREGEPILFFTEMKGLAGVIFDPHLDGQGFIEQKLLAVEDDYSGNDTGIPLVWELPS